MTRTARSSRGHVAWLGEEPTTDPATVGGKVAALSRLTGDFDVPPGFCLTDLAPESTDADQYQDDLVAAYHELAHRCGESDPVVAVRSSAADEDGLEASFAGQHDTILGVAGEAEVVAAARKCLASFLSERALAYRREHSLAATPPRAAVLVQHLVPADVSGVAFSNDPVTGDHDTVIVNASFGLGESVVSGTVTPDTYRACRDTRAVTHRETGSKQVMTVPVPGGVQEVPVPRSLRDTAALDDEQIRAVAGLAIDLEGRTGGPVDVEFAWHRDRLHLLQCRPITTNSEKGTMR